MNIPRFVIAGAHSGTGKTTLTLGLLAVLKKAGYNVQPYKVGPDYIDPGLHRAVCDINSHNLDSWMGNEDVVSSVFETYSSNKDIAVIEGVMGLFDGVKGNLNQGSTAHIAKILNAPVILIVNAKGMAGSCAALIKGFKEFDKDVNLAGVIFNNVGSENHARFLEDIVNKHLDIPCVGYLIRNEKIVMPERHLGLLPASENCKLKNQIKPLIEIIEKGINLDKLLEIARKAPPVSKNFAKGKFSQKKVKIGVAWDSAFNFYYQDSITFLHELGAEIKYFSPLKDEEIPDVHGLYLGGGFPEMFLDDLAANREICSQIKQKYKNGMPIYAECGGYMFLMEKIKDFKGNRYSGLGIIPGEVRMTKKLAALGYVKATSELDTILLSTSEEIRGHEFHWSEMEGIPEKNAAYTLVGGRGQDGRKEGFAYENLLGSYVHLHLRSNPNAAQGFISSCHKYKEVNNK